MDPRVLLTNLVTSAGWRLEKTLTDCGTFQSGKIWMLHLRVSALTNMTGEDTIMVAQGVGIGRTIEAATLACTRQICGFIGYMFYSGDRRIVTAATFARFKSNLLRALYAFTPAPTQPQYSFPITIPPDFNQRGPAVEGTPECSALMRWVDEMISRPDEAHPECRVTLGYSDARPPYKSEPDLETGKPLFYFLVHDWADNAVLGYLPAGGPIRFFARDSDGWERSIYSICALDKPGDVIYISSGPGSYRVVFVRNEAGWYRDLTQEGVEPNPGPREPNRYKEARLTVTCPVCDGRAKMINRHRFLRIDFTNEKNNFKLIMRICNQVYVATVNSVLLSESQLKAAYGHCKRLGLGAADLKRCMENREVLKRVGKRCWTVQAHWVDGSDDKTWVYKNYGRHVTWSGVNYFGVPEQVYRLIEKHINLCPRPVLVHPSVGPGEPLIAFVKGSTRRPTTIEGLCDWWTYAHDELIQWWRLDEEFKRETSFPGWKLPYWAPPQFTPPDDLTREGIEPNPGWGRGSDKRASGKKGASPGPQHKPSSGGGKKETKSRGKSKEKSKNPRKEYQPRPMRTNYDRKVQEAISDANLEGEALEDVEYDVERDQRLAIAHEQARAALVPAPPVPVVPTAPPPPTPPVNIPPSGLTQQLLQIRCQAKECKKFCHHAVPKVWCKKVGSSSSSASAPPLERCLMCSGYGCACFVGEEVRPVVLGREVATRPLPFRGSPSAKAGCPVERVVGVRSAGSPGGAPATTVVYGPRPGVQPVRLVNLPVPPPPPMPIIRWRQSRRIRLKTLSCLEASFKVVNFCPSAGNWPVACETRHYGLQWPCFDPIPEPPALPEPFFKNKDELKEFNREQRELQKKIDEHEAALNTLLGAGRCKVHKVCPQHCSGRVRTRATIKKRWASETSVSNWTPFVALFVFSLIWCAVALSLWNTLPDTWWAGIILFVTGPAPNGLVISSLLIVLRLFAGRAFIQHIYLMQVDQHNFSPSVLVNFNPKDNTVDVRTDHSKVDHMTHADPFLCDATYVRKLSFDGWAGRARRGSKNGKHTRTATLLTWVMKLMGMFEEECKQHTVSLALLAQLVNANNCSIDADDEVAWQRINQYNRTRGAINIDQYHQVGKCYVHADTVLFAFATFKDMKRRTAHLPFPASPGLDLLSPMGMATAKSRYLSWSKPSQELSHLPSGTRAL